MISVDLPEEIRKCLEIVISDKSLNPSIIEYSKGQKEENYVRMETEDVEGLGLVVVTIWTFLLYSDITITTVLIRHTYVVDPEGEESEDVSLYDVKE